MAEEIEVRLASDKKLGDDEIAARAARLLRWDASVPDDRITVKVEQGIVTLGRQVDWQFQRAEAEHDVRKPTGVRGVVNVVTVAPKPRAADIRDRVPAALERNEAAERIAMTITGGKVTVSGKVAVSADRDVAERAAWSVPGVIEVVDRIELVGALSCAGG